MAIVCRAPAITSHCLTQVPPLFEGCDGEIFVFPFQPDILIQVEDHFLNFLHSACHLVLFFSRWQCFMWTVMGGRGRSLILLNVGKFLKSLFAVLWLYSLYIDLLLKFWLFLLSFLYPAPFHINRNKFRSYSYIQRNYIYTIKTSSGNYCLALIPLEELSKTMDF